MEENKKTNNSDDCSLYIGGCCIFLSVLVILGCAISYLVFGIMYLVQDYSIVHECNGSSLWAYVLTAIILSLLRCNSKNAKDEHDNVNFCVLICLGLVELGLAIWGGVELWVNSCDTLIDTNIWKFALATFILQSFVATLLLVIIPITFCVCAFRTNTEVENDNQNNRKTDNILSYKNTEGSVAFDNV